jgi:hypothetical protein
MTPRLVPYTWFRHVLPGLLGGMAGMCAWWVALVVIDLSHGGGRAAWSPDTEGAVLLSLVSAAAAVTSVQLEGRWERAGVRRRLGAGAVAAACAGLGTLASCALWFAARRWWGVEPEFGLALRGRLFPWLLAGGWLTAGLMTVRLGRYLLDDLQRRWEMNVMDPPPPLEGSRWALLGAHALVGPLCGVAAAVVGYTLGLWLDDLYLAGMGASWSFAALAGALTWGIPDRAWQPWVMVRVGARPGWRIPLDAEDTALQERFVGHFPSGMDLHLPGTDGVAELHLSVLARGDADHIELAARGLSQRPVTVIRPLERVDLAYDPALPAPLETTLRHEDRIRLGEVAEVEVLVLSREGSP